MPDEPIYRVAFINQNQVYELYARRVYQGELFGFVVLEDFVFGEVSSVVVDPAEEKLKAEFGNVRRSFVPMHQIIRIDLVERRGKAKIAAVEKDAGSNVTRLYIPEKPA